MSHNNYTRPRTLYTIFVYFFNEGCTCHVESAVRVHQTVFWDGGPIIWQEIEKARQRQLRKDLIDKYKIQRELNKVNMKRMLKSLEPGFRVSKLGVGHLTPRMLVLHTSAMGISLSWESFTPLQLCETPF